MNRKIIVTLFLISSLSFSALYAHDKKSAWIREMATNKNPHISAQTHPTLYATVENLVEKTGAAKPRYISLFNAEYTRVRDGYTEQGVHEINAYVDVLGDLHICSELLTNLSSEEVEVLITRALVERTESKPAILFGTAAVTYIVAFIGLYTLMSKAWNVNTGYHYSHMHWRDRDDFYKVLITLPAIPAAWATKIVANNLEKQTDITTATITSPELVINGIQGQDRVTEIYDKQNFFARIADALKLREIRNFIFYPIRAYTTEERVAYLSKLQ